MKQQFREKTKVIEAMFFDGTQDELMEVLEWILAHGYIWFDMFTPAPIQGVTIDGDTGFLNIMTGRGLMAARKGQHYIVLQPSGEMKPVPKHEFESVFEALPELPSGEPNPGQGTPGGPNG